MIAASGAVLATGGSSGGLGMLLAGLWPCGHPTDAMPQIHLLNRYNNPQFLAQSTALQMLTPIIMRGNKIGETVHLWDGHTQGLRPQHAARAPRGGPEPGGSGRNHRRRPRPCGFNGTRSAKRHASYYLAGGAGVRMPRGRPAR